MTRLVACDIDGTLLDGSTAIAPAVFTQIRRLSRLGCISVPPAAGSTAACAACSLRWPAS